MLAGDLVGPGSLVWRRLRYVDPTQACAALTMLAEAGASIELRLRHAGQIVALYAGLGERWASVLEQMAPDFGLDLSVDLKAGLAEAQEPRPLAGRLVPGAWGELPAEDADARLAAPGGMQVRRRDAEQPGRRVDRLLGPLAPVLHSLRGLRAPAPAGEPAELPIPVLGVHARPELPFAIRCPQGSAWEAKAGGLAAPACLIGADRAVRVLGLSLAEVALGEDRPTVIVDGTGELARGLRDVPSVRRALASGRLVELSVTCAGQRGFNPLMASSLRGAEHVVTLARWRWWLRGLGIYEQPIVEAAYASGAHTPAALARFWAGRADTLLAAHVLGALLSAGDVATWMGGSFDVARHLRAGGHVLVECPGAQGARLQALRGLLGLAAEGGARLLSMGVCWPGSDDAMLVRLEALCHGHTWEAAALAGRSTRLTAVFTHGSEEPAWAGGVVGAGRLSELLATLPPEVGVVHLGGEWWLIQAGDGGAGGPGGVGRGAEDDPSTTLRTSLEALRREAEALAGEVERGEPRGPRRPVLLEAYGATAAEGLACIRAQQNRVTHLGM